MRHEAFLRERQGEWTRLAEYADRLERKGPASLSSQEILDFVALYRRATSDLARARTLKVGSDVVDRLNRLVGRIHFHIYTAPSLPAERILRYFTNGFPQAVRRNRRWVAASAALFLIPALAAFAAVESNPALAFVFSVGPEYVRQLDEQFGSSFGVEGPSPGAAAMGTSLYIFNNVQVSFLAFACGVFFGLGSAYILALNGAILGGVTAVVGQYGLSGNFWSFVAPHGGIELSAIVLAGAAGLMVGSKLVNPGPYTRRRALVVASREAARILFGVIALLVAAALIEAAVSPSAWPRGIKVAIGIANLTGLVTYFTLAGRVTINSQNIS
ncbi:MAG: stage II sporulation protein M [Planctomycetes bacterium]|nr:stage II sporulation protein M [Planctomycetota bacterium]